MLIAIIISPIRMMVTTPELKFEKSNPNIPSVRSGSPSASASRNTDVPSAIPECSENKAIYIERICLSLI